MRICCNHRAQYSPHFDEGRQPDKASRDADADDAAWQSGGERSDSESDRDSCLDEELETDDPEILVVSDGRALSQKLASEVSTGSLRNHYLLPHILIAAPNVGENGGQFDAEKSRSDTWLRLRVDGNVDCRCVSSPSTLSNTAANSLFNYQDEAHHPSDISVHRKPAADPRTNDSEDAWPRREA